MLGNEQVPAPWHTPPQVPLPAHSSFGSLPMMPVHCPVRSQRTQRPSHAVLQQTPSAQKLLPHCVPPVQVAPSGSRAEPSGRLGPSGRGPSGGRGPSRRGPSRLGPSRPVGARRVDQGTVHLGGSIYRQGVVTRITADPCVTRQGGRAVIGQALACRVVKAPAGRAVLGGDGAPRADARALERGELARGVALAVVVDGRAAGGNASSQDQQREQSVEHLEPPPGVLALLFEKLRET